MEFSEIKSLLQTQIPGAVLGEDLDATPNAILIDPAKLTAVAELLYSHQQTYFDLLSCISGIDNGPEANTMEVIYNLYSLPYHVHLMLKCTLDRALPQIDTVSHIWRTANWHERETYDLLGISFSNHPDLRRILLPADWVGYPLRKDYQEQEKYRGITVVYDREQDGDPV